MNEVHVAGVVKRTWTYGNDLYARLSLRRDHGRRQRESGAGGPFDYVTILFPDGLRQGLRLPSDRPITVHGWVQSRDVDESLAQFLKRADMPSFLTLDLTAAAGIVVHRSVTEIVAERWEASGRAPSGGRRQPPV